MSRPSRPCLPFLLKTGDNDVSVGAAFPDLAINGRAEIASTSFAVYRPQARNFGFCCIGGLGLKSVPFLGRGCE